MSRAPPPVRRTIDPAGGRPGVPFSDNLHERKTMSMQNPLPGDPSHYMLLFRGNDWATSLSPEEIQNVLARWNAWYERLTAEGKAKAGQPLGREGKVVTGKKGRNVADGPFAESKEAVGGYFLLNVATMEEAVDIARECPGLDYGAAVEVRPVAHQCGIQARADELAEATA